MTVEIKEVRSKSELEVFMSLPIELYKGFPEFVPPLMIETRGILDPKSAPFFKYGEATYWLAYKNGCLLYTSPSPRDLSTSRMPSSA